MELKVERFITITLTDMEASDLHAIICQEIRRTESHEFAQQLKDLLESY